MRSRYTRPFAAFHFLFATVAVLISAVHAQTPVNVTVNSSSGLGVIPPAARGVNTNVNDQNLDDQAGSTVTLDANVDTALKSIGTNALRFPGGQEADKYHRVGTYNGQPLANYSVTSNASPPLSQWQAGENFDNFIKIEKYVGASPIITVNYGSNQDATGPGDPNEAAAWVTYANVTKNYGVKYWEIGNEVYASTASGQGGEQNLHSDTSSTAYGNNVVTYVNAMKAQDPTIKIGVTLPAPGADQADGPLPNWNSTVLSECGTSIDFVVVHYYAYGGLDANDSVLLGRPRSSIAGIMTRTRALINQYCGANAPNVQIFITETNSAPDNPTKQTANLVEALFAADDVQTLLENGVGNYDFWELHGSLTRDPGNFSNIFNAVDVNGYGAADDPTLYGSNLYDDGGLLSNNELGLTAYLSVTDSSGVPSQQVTETNGQNDAPLPAYYGNYMAGLLGGPGDTMVASATSQPLVVSHAVKQANGKIALLLINQSPNTSYAATVAIQGYSSSWSAPSLTYFYGESSSGATGYTLTPTTGTTGSSFSQTLPPYSMTTVVLSPTPTSPTLLAAVSAPYSAAKGASATLTAAITNSGAALSNAAVTIQVYNLAGTRVSLGTFSGQSLPAKQTLTKQYNWTAPGVTGTYYVSVGVTDSTGNTQYYWGSSLAAIQVTSDGSAPPVQQINSSNFTATGSVAPTTVVVGQATNITIACNDIGASLNNSIIQMQTYLSGGGSAQPAQLSGRLNWLYGQTQSWTFPWTAPSTPGVYVVGGGVVPPNNSSGGNYGYNGNITTIQVDSVAPSMSLSATFSPSTVAPGAVSTITAITTDTGGALSNSVAEIDIYRPVSSTYWQLVASSVYSGQNWSAGGTNTYPYNWTAPSTPGPYYLFVTVKDPSGNPNYGYISVGTITVAAPPVSVTVGNFGFETPSIPSGQFQYGPAGATWTFGSNTGIAANGSAFNNPTAPQGTQVAIVQQSGTISQTLTSTSAGVWTISVSSTQRTNSAQTVNVLLDGTKIGSIKPTSTSFATYTVTSPSSVSAGSHTLAFQGTTTADNTAFIDNVQVTSQ